MDDETGESPNFKKFKLLRLQIVLALRDSAVLLSWKKIYSRLFTADCTRNHVIIYIQNFVFLE